jgi:uncharacterized protein with von Willebrand factor type A (vWA) domain
VLEHVEGFVRELRDVGLPISLADKIDALRALREVDPTEREDVHAALVATLVKRHDHRGAFDAVFDIYFSGDRLGQHASPSGATGAAADRGDSTENPTFEGGPLGATTPEQLVEMLRRAIAGDDGLLLRLIAKEAVRRFSGFEPGRPVGGTYYVMRALRQVDLGAVLSALHETTGRDRREGRLDALGARLEIDRHELGAQTFRQEVESEVRRLVAEDRGTEALARALREPLPENLEFVNANASDIDAMRQVLVPLVRRLASHLARRRRGTRSGRLDVRATIRSSMTYGGVPAVLHFKPPRPSKIELVVVADISGSVASFARFTLQLLYALRSQFTKVRSFVFVDGLTEVTDLLARAEDVEDLRRMVNQETAMLWVDGHSDYGHAFRTLASEHADAITSRCSVLILGDARNNYHAAEADALAEVGRRARHVFWLNPEPEDGWDTGDSIVSRYAPYCEEVLECRNLEQLRAFVERLA